MKTRLLHWWDDLNSSLWFIPALMTIVTVAVSFATITLDWSIREKLVTQTGWIWTGGPDGAREILSTVAGSMITVAGVVFSITVVVLTLASSQFGPRLLRSFMRDRGNQVVLGTFISTFTYCLLVLRTIRTDDEGAEFVPHISVTLGIVLALFSLGVLIYFIHHVSVSIQASMIIARVAEELDAGIKRLFPEQFGQNGEKTIEPQNDLLPDLEQEGSPVASCSSGYLQAIDTEGIMQLAADKDIVVHVRYRPGEFIVQGSELARIWPKQPVDESLTNKINSFFILGTQRTEEQDVEFAVHQLVEIAVRALSPGINDPFTAMTCVDHLGASLCRLAQRKIPPPYWCDQNGRLRVVAYGPTFVGIVDAAVTPIRRYGRSHALVLIRLLERLTDIGRCVRRKEDREIIFRHALLIQRLGYDSLSEETEREAVEQQYQRFLDAFGDCDWLCEPDRIKADPA